ncbi:MAG TPA: HAD-IA family hydrolase [Candidatus Limnocylindria bacterium]|nr:HAD-IA family hydrolase [Candidatus Limnocylindria bacterium]
MSLRALVFDFDGLLLETETPSYTAWAEIYREHGEELPLDKWFDYLGREGGWFDALAYLRERVAGDHDWEAIRARRNARRTEMILRLDLMPGVRELVDAARGRGLRLGVASSSSDAWVCGHLDRFGFREHWDAIVCREEGMRAKPAPDLYLAALAALGVAAHEAVALEDSRNGVLAAKAAGMRVVAVPNALTARLDLSPADLRVSSLADLRIEDLVALTSGA